MNFERSTEARNIDLDRIVDSVYWGAHGIPHEELRYLRQSEPVWRYEGSVVDPFWMLTRYEDVTQVSRDNASWSSVWRSVLEHPRGEPQMLRSIVQMDPPEHGKYREVIQAWLTPRALKSLEVQLAEVSKQLIDRLVDAGEIDFVTEVAAPHPLRMICTMLGIPKTQEPDVLRLSKSIFGANDPDVSDAGNHMMALPEVLEFCSELTEARRRNPTNDMASAVANAKIDGELIGMHEAVSHLLVLISAGHDTTSSAISGGLRALIEHPEELAKLKADMTLLPSAINEILRWVTPTTNFLRTALCDVELSGVTIPAGDDVCMSYASANRDEDVFEDPYRFRIDRKPNKHLSFGIGAHACVGQVLARLEITALLRELIPRLNQAEILERPEFVKAFWVSNLKHLKIRADL